MKVLIIDNYDSFTYNLYQYVGEILEDTNSLFQLDVFRNDAITIEQVQKTHYDKIIISPGPGEPADPQYFGVCSQVILEIGKDTPILGVCLGMQGIAHCYGGNIIRAKLPKHGKTDTIVHDEKGIFKGLPQNLSVMRYHSLIADPKTIPACLEVSAKVIWDEDYFEIMGLRHKEYSIEGIQFHPESFATEGGFKILENFIFN